MKFNLAKIREQFGEALQKARRYSVPVFFLFLFGIYGFLSWRIYTLNEVGADPNAVQSKLKTASVPRIDEEVLEKIEKLQDNSVEVKSLFDQARRNPFQE